MAWTACESEVAVGSRGHLGHAGYRFDVRAVGYTGQGCAEGLGVRSARRVLRRRTMAALLPDTAWMNDQELITAFRETADADLFRMLVERHQDRVFRLVAS